MRDIIFKQATKLINEENIDDWRILQAKALLKEVEKESGLWDWISNPMLSTVLSLLKPFAGSNYKIEQAIKLLIEGLKEAKVI